MIGSFILSSPVLPKTYTPRRKHTTRRARHPLTTFKKYQRVFTGRAVQRVQIRWRIPTTSHQWNVPTVRSSIYHERSLDEWTPEEICRFWEECSYRPGCMPRLDQGIFQTHKTHQIEEMKARLKQTRAVLEPKTTAYETQFLRDAYARRTPRKISQLGWQSDIHASILSAPRRAIPQKWEAVMDDYMIATGVTHYLCYSGPPRISAAGSRRGIHVSPRELRIIPVDALLLTLYCLRLPSILNCKPQVEYLRKESLGHTPNGESMPTSLFNMCLPTLYITVPDPLSLPILLQFLETRNKKLLACNILGVKAPDRVSYDTAPRSEPLPRSEVEMWAVRVAVTCLPTEIAERMRWCIGIWKNARALCILDEGLSGCLTDVWLILHCARDVQIRTSSSFRFHYRPLAPERIIHHYPTSERRPSKTAIFSSPLHKSHRYEQYFEKVAQYV